MTSTHEQPVLAALAPAVACALAVMSVYAFGIYLFSAQIPMFMLEVGIGMADAGLVTSVGMIAFLSGALTTHHAVELLGEKHLILATLMACSLSYFLLSGAQTLVSLILLRAVLGFASATIWVPMVRLVPRFAPWGFAGLLLGITNSGSNIGIVLNGAILAWIQPSFGSQGVWTFASLLTFFSFLVFGVVVPRSDTSQNTRKESSSRNRPGPSVPLKFIILLAALSGAVGVPGTTFLSAYAQSELGRPPESSGLMWALIGITGAAGSIILGRIADKSSVLLTVAVAFACQTAAFTFIALNFPLISQFGLEACACVMAVGYFALYGLLPTLISGAVPVRFLVSAFGYATAFQALGGAAGNFVVGLVLETSSSYIFVYAALGAIAFIAAIV